MATETPPAAPRHPPAPRGSLRVPSLVAGVCFLLGALSGLGVGRGLRFGAGLRLRRGLRPLRGFRLLTSALVVGVVEAGSLAHHSVSARVLSLCLLVTG